MKSSGPLLVNVIPLWWGAARNRQVNAQALSKLPFSKLPFSFFPMKLWGAFSCGNSSRPEMPAKRQERLRDNNGQEAPEGGHLKGGHLKIACRYGQLHRESALCRQGKHRVDNWVALVNITMITILFKIITRMRLSFSNYLGDCSYNLQGSSELISITVTVSSFLAERSYRK